MYVNGQVFNITFALRQILTLPTFLRVTLVVLLCAVVNCEELFHGAKAALNQDILEFMLRSAATLTGSQPPSQTTNCSAELSILNMRSENIFNSTAFSACNKKNISVLYFIWAIVHIIH